ncbi:TetR family transcriptional regulator [Nocardia sp. NPDC001965]
MPYDADATRTRIFDAATTEFAEYGVAGARVDRIASRAHANKASIYAYFGDKEQLFAAVLDRKLGELADAVTLEPNRAPEYVGELFDFHLAHPEVIRLLAYEALHHGTQPVPDEQTRAAHYQDKADALVAAQRDGQIDSHLNPRHLVLILTGLVGWYFSTPQVTRMLLADANDPAVLAEYRTTAVEAARRIIAPACHERQEKPPP